MKKSFFVLFSLLALIIINVKLTADKNDFMGLSLKLLSSMAYGSSESGGGTNNGYLKVNYFMDWEIRNGCKITISWNTGVDCPAMNIEACTPSSSPGSVTYDDPNCRYT